MPTFTQDSRLIAINTPLGANVLLLKSFQMTDGLGRPFVCTCDVRSEKHDIEAKDIIGQPATVRVQQTDGKTKYINGVISRFSQEGTPAVKRINKYSLTIVPALWFLSRTADCRIFQAKSVPDVIKEVLQQFGVTNLELKVTATYDAREFIVQYRETAFNFVSRLMEEEGLFYFFNHENGKHTMVIADAPSIFKPAPGYEKIQFLQQDDDAGGHEHISRMTWECAALPGAFVLRDYDFKAPAKYLDGDTKTVQQKHSQKDFEVYDYPGFFEKQAEGERYVKVRMEESDATHEVHRFQGDTRGLTVGAKFKLFDFPIDAKNKDYVVTAAQLHGETEEYGSGGGGGGGGGGKSDHAFHITFTAISATVPYRSARSSSKPSISGPQTAFVTGPSGEEIYVDEFGRVKVQFIWDRDGKGDEKSSCWIRVSQGWAGKKWGMVFLPRIGQEVIVEFLEGDPDRPIVTGRVYNGGTEGQIPYKLPDFKTVSTIKSCTSKGGGGFNEIRFEDKKGEEEIFIHAEKDMQVRVKNDRTELTLNNQHLVVKKDQYTRIEQDRHSIIKRDRLEEIQRDNFQNIAGDSAVKIEKTLSLHVVGDVAENFDANHHEMTKANIFYQATKIVLEGSENITLKVGDTTLAMTKDGLKIETKGKIALDAKDKITVVTVADFTVEATAKVGIKGTAGLTLESPAKADMKSALTTVSADGNLTLKGAMVMIN